MGIVSFYINFCIIIDFSFWYRVNDVIFYHIFNIEDNKEVEICIFVNDHKERDVVCIKEDNKIDSIYVNLSNYFYPFYHRCNKKNNFRILNKKKIKIIVFLIYHNDYFLFDNDKMVFNKNLNVDNLDFYKDIYIVNYTWKGNYD